MVDRQYFRIDRIEGQPDAAILAAYQQPLLALPLAGELTWDDAGRAHGGECVLAGSIDELDFSRSGVTLLTRPN